jgi:hypothetical protein
MEDKKNEVEEVEEVEIPAELKFKTWGTAPTSGYGAWIFVGGFLVLVGLAYWIF